MNIDNVEEVEKLVREHHKLKLEKDKLQHLLESGNVNQLAFVGFEGTNISFPLTNRKEIEVLVIQEISKINKRIDSIVSELEEL